MRTTIALVVLILVPACGILTTEHVYTGPPVPPYAGEPRVVMEGAPLPAKLQEVAIIQVHATADKANLPNVLGAMKEYAARLGCNIVVNVRIDRGSSMSATGTCGVAAVAASPPAQ